MPVFRRSAALCAAAFLALASLDATAIEVREKATPKARTEERLSREEAHRLLTSRHAGELVAQELTDAQKQLGEITGQITSDDLLGRIFGSFCIGK